MPAEDDYKKFNELADELGYEGKQRDTFINDAMEHKGHISKSVWEDAPPPGAGDGDKSGDGDFFANRKVAREKARAEAAAQGGTGGAGDGDKGGDKGGNWQGYGS
jgi:hypothetical protein